MARPPSDREFREPTGRYSTPRGFAALGRLLLGHLAAFRDRHLQDVATATLRDESGRQAWVVAAVNGSLRARRALTRMLTLEPRTARSWLRFRLEEKGSPPAPRRRLSLLCPTRGRARLVATFLSSVHRTAAVPGRVEALFYVDSDDPDLPEYRELFRRASDRYPRLGTCRLVEGEPVGVPEAWNALAALADGDLLLMANDDQLYVDFGWDVGLDRRMAQIGALAPDEVCCLYFDAGQYADGGCDFPIVSRRWYQTLGYFTPTMFQQWEVERWVFDLAGRIDRLYRVPGVLVEHRHYQDYKAPFDKTYQRHRLTRAKSFSDHALFLQTEAGRVADAAALQRAIDEFRSDGAAGAVTEAAAWFVPHLEQSCSRIRAEVETVLGQAGHPLREQGRVELIHVGQWSDPNRALFPVTAAALAAIPEVTTLGPGRVTICRPGRAPFDPGAAPTTGVLRGYLGVRIPDGVGLTVGGRALALKDGRCVVTAAVAGALAATGGDPLVLVFDVLPPPR